MATATAPLVPRAWLRLPIRSARLRLTLLYSGMFLLLGTALIVLILLTTNSSSVAVSAVPAQGGGFQGPLLHAAASHQQSADSARLLAASWLTLALTAAASAVIGWFLAGRVLRPLREMTTAARAISAGNLHERIALAGPDDEFKQLGDTFDELLTRLEGSFAAQRRFVANAAHELRTPLTVERTLLQVALADPDANAASLRATCEELLASGRDQERLLDALLTLATSERGVERRTPIDLAAVVETQLAAARAELERASLELTYSQLVPVEIMGDSSLIERLVGNLIDNAVRYNDPGGSLEVRTLADGDRAVLTVANTGPRIHPEDVERLFEPFRRLRTDRTGPADGHHGLGLSIVRAVAAAHDATVTATARPDGGLAVAVTFPLTASPGGASSADD